MRDELESEGKHREVRQAEAALVHPSVMLAGGVEADDEAVRALAAAAHLAAERLASEITGDEKERVGKLGKWMLGQSKGNGLGKNVAVEARWIHE